MRLLWPKMRKRSGRLGGKGAPGSARAAILNFLAALPPVELRPLLGLFLAPLGPALRPPKGPAPPAAREPAGAALRPLTGVDRQAAAAADGRGGRVGENPSTNSTAPGLFEEPWWAPELGSRDAAWWLAAVDVGAYAALPARTRLGFLNAAADLLRHLGHRLAPYLPALAALAVVALEAATAPLACALGAPGNLPSPGPLRAPAAGAGPAGNESLARHQRSLEAEEAGTPDERVAEGAGEGEARQATHEAAAARSADGMAGQGAGNDGADGHMPSEEPSREGLAGQGAAEGAREVRGAALQLLAELWGRFPDAADWAPLWPRFFAAAAPLAQRLPAEVGCKH